MSTAVPIPIRFALSSDTTSPSSSNNGSSDSDEGLRLTRALVENGAVALERLLLLQNEGWNDEATGLQYHKRHPLPDDVATKLNVEWFRKTKKMFQEINYKLKVFGVKEPLRFLDLGCCPGGFSSHILDKNPYANGVGVSLPVEDGGHKLLLEKKHRARFVHISADPTFFQNGPPGLTIDDPRLKPLPSELGDSSFDLVMLGHQLRSTATVAAASPWEHDRLLIALLILGLQAVKVGGTIVIKLPLPHKPTAAKILFALKTVSGRVLRIKPEKMHAHRGVFYAVVKGVGVKRDGGVVDVGEVLRSLRELWVEIMVGGEDGIGQGLREGDLDFMASVDDIVGTWRLGWLVNFGERLWIAQEKALGRVHGAKERSLEQRE